MPIASVADNALYLGLGALCFVMITVAVVRRARERGATAREVTRAERAFQREQRELMQQMEELLGQLDGLAKHVGVQVDQQLGRLETALRSADERIARLEAADQKTSAAATELPAKSRAYTR
jgi:CRISPR/Cas system-associated exonuclease Cas4 (RecB family)